MFEKDSKAAGIIFANVHDTSLSALTQNRTLASVPYGGRYRLVDFPLSDFVNAGVYDVGLITRANYQSLMDHVGSGRDWDLSRKNGGLRILPPYGNKNYGMYSGKIEALGAALDFLKKLPQEYVILSDCEMIANIDLKPFIEQHHDSDADITVMYSHSYLPNDSAKDATIFTLDENQRVTESMFNADISGEFDYSLNKMIMGREFLIQLVTECISKGEYSFAKDVLQKRNKDFKIYGYKYEGFIGKISSITDYFNTNLLLLENVTRDRLFRKDRPIYTKVRDEAPVRYGLDSDVKNSFIADGCLIEGKVENSILFRGCKVGKGAVVKNSILMQGTKICDNALVEYSITDKNVLISSSRTLIGTDNYPSYVTKGSQI